jgi:hypothetical protein
LNDIIFWVIFSFNLMVVLFVTIAKAIRLKLAIVFTFVLQISSGFLLSKRPFLSLETEARVLNDVIFWVIFSLYLMVVLFVTVTKAVRFKLAIVFTFVLHNRSGMLLSEGPVLSLETEARVLNDIIFWVIFSFNLMVVLFVTIAKAIRLKLAIVFTFVLQISSRFLLSERPFLSLETESSVLDDIVFRVIFSLNLMVVLFVTITKAV